MLKRIILLSLTICFIAPLPSYARSSRNHLIKGTKSIGKAIADPLHGIFVIGPKNIKSTWNYEVHQREKEEDRNRLRGKLFAIWRAPGDEIKGAIDGITNCAKNLGSGFKEYLSIIFSD